MCSYSLLFYEQILISSSYLSFFPLLFYTLKAVRGKKVPKGDRVYSDIGSNSLLNRFKLFQTVSSSLI